jgi:hypothetical protein
MGTGQPVREMRKARECPRRTEWRDKKGNTFVYVHTADRIYWAWRVLTDYQEEFETGRRRVHSHG